MYSYNYQFFLKILNTIKETDNFIQPKFKVTITFTDSSQDLILASKELIEANIKFSVNEFNLTIFGGY